MHRPVVIIVDVLLGWSWEGYNDVVISYDVAFRNSRIVAELVFVLDYDVAVYSCVANVDPDAIST